MKKSCFSLLVIVTVAVSCQSASDKTKTETVVTDTAQSVEVVAPIVTPVAAQLYACSMHPEVQGKKGEQCSKCGMDLTVAVPGK